MALPGLGLTNYATYIPDRPTPMRQLKKNYFKEFGFAREKREGFSLYLYTSDKTLDLSKVSNDSVSAIYQQELLTASDGAVSTDMVEYIKTLPINMSIPLKIYVIRHIFIEKMKIRQGFSQDPFASRIALLAEAEGAAEWLILEAY